MQAIIISALDMWPATSLTAITTSSDTTVLRSSDTTNTSSTTPYRPFEELIEFRPNPFPSPEPPAPPPAALSPPMPISGTQWTLSPPTEEGSSVEPVRMNFSFMRGCDIASNDEMLR